MAAPELLKREAPDAPWMVAGVGADVLPLIPEVVAVGGHVRVGLEDAPLGSTLRNEEWVRRAADAIVTAAAASPPLPTRGRNGDDAFPTIEVNRTCRDARRGAAIDPNRLFRAARLDPSGTSG
jgi:hypothetical protein